MILKFLFLMAITIINVMEAKHDYYVIKNCEGNDKRIHQHYNNRWHLYSFMIWGLLYLLIISLLYHNPLIKWRCIFYLNVLISARGFIFSTYLNHIRGKGMTYLSNNGSDGWVKKRIGERLYFQIRAFYFTLSTIILILS